MSFVAPPPSYLGPLELGTPTPTTTLYQPPAYLFEELVLTEDPGSLTADGIDPIVASLDRERSSWTVAELSTGTEREQAQRLQERQSRKTTREVLHTAIINGQVPFLALGSKNVVTDCTPEAIASSVDAIAASLKAPSHPTSLASSSTQPQHLLSEEELKRLLSSQCFMDILAWQRLEQIHQALDPSASTHDFGILSSDVKGNLDSSSGEERTAKRLKLEDGTATTAAATAGTSPSVDPWTIGDLSSISHVSNALIAEKAPLYQSLGELVGQAWRKQKDASLQTDIRAPGTNQLTPYADLQKSEGSTTIEMPMPAGSAEGVTYGHISLLEPSFVRRVLAEQKTQQRGDGNPTQLAGGGEKPEEREEGGSILSQLRDCPVLRQVPITTKVTKLGKVLRSPENNDDNSGDEALMSFPIFDLTQWGSIATATCPADAAGTIAEHHATLQLVRAPTQKSKEGEKEETEAAASAVSQFFLKNYSKNGVRLLSQGRWVLGEVGTLASKARKPTSDSGSPTDSTAIEEVLAFANDAIFCRVVIDRCD